MRHLKTFILLSIIMVLSACDDDIIDTDMSEEIADFQFTTQDNEKLGLEDLEGEWWIAYFMYTECTIVCPQTTPNMVKVQKELGDLGLEPQIISFSIDPENDTPDVLKEYADEYQVDLSNWTFLTGYDFDEIQKLSKKSFKTVLEGGGPNTHEFVHSTYFFLVNPDGQIVKKYDGLSDEEVDALIGDLKKAL